MYINTGNMNIIYDIRNILYNYRRLLWNFD